MVHMDQIEKSQRGGGGEGMGGWGGGVGGGGGGGGVGGGGCGVGWGGVQGGGNHRSVMGGGRYAQSSAHVALVPQSTVRSKSCGLCVT